MSAANVLELCQVERHFVQGERKLTVLNGVDFALAPGEMVALVAPSGAGKSTMLHLAGLLERPDAGDILLGGRACGRLKDEQRTAIRRNEIGFVYQFHHLLPEFSALENIMVPQLVRGLGKQGSGRPRRTIAGIHEDRQARASTGPPSFPAANSSAWRSPAPWPTRRGCSWPTSRPAISTPRPRCMCSRRWRRWCASPAFRR